MDIKMIYKGESFWGTTTQREDEMHWANMKHLSKCLRRLKVDPTAAVHIANFSKNKEAVLVLVWDTYKDQENGTLTVREYERWNSYTDTKMAFSKAKKYVENMIVEGRRCEDEV